jgi:hypothetical protein
MRIAPPDSYQFLHDSPRRATIVRMDVWLAPAVGVALSPLPVLGMLLVLGGARPTVTGPAFWAAWTLGVAVPTGAFVLLAENVAAVEGDSGVLAGAELAVGILLLAVAVRLWLARRAGTAGVAPWLDALDRSGPSRAAALAVILSALNPKNLALMLTAGVAIARAEERGGALTVATVAFVAIAVSTVSVLLLGFAAFPRRSSRALAALRAAVARNDRALAIVLGALIGSFFVLDGLRGL